MIPLRFCVFIAMASIHVYGQVLNRVFVLNYRDYVVNVIGETMREVEQREWCNLKILDTEQNINTTAVDIYLLGTVRYTKGFVTSIQKIDVLQSSVAQRWGNGVNGTIEVDLRGQMRMTNLGIGFNVEAQLENGTHHYTGNIVHPLVTFDFSIIWNAHTHEKRVAVVGNRPSSTLPRMRALPSDAISDALTSLYVTSSTFEAIMAWGGQVFQPIASEVAENKVEFPGLCYDCPAT